MKVKQEKPEGGSSSDKSQDSHWWLIDFGLERQQSNGEKRENADPRSEPIETIKPIESIHDQKKPKERKKDTR